jgi:hypothetical protein
MVARPLNMIKDTNPYQRTIRTLTRTRWFLLLFFISCVFISCTNPSNTAETTRNDGDNVPISPEAAWAQAIASLRLDDGGTNNGRARIQVLEILYMLRGRLETGEITPDLREDIIIIRGAMENIYASANVQARNEWQFLSRDFAALENQLNNPEEARTIINQILARIGG